MVAYIIPREYLDSGVSYVLVDLARSALVDQCAPSGGASFLADSNQCQRRVRGSQVSNASSEHTANCISRQVWVAL